MWSGKHYWRSSVSAFSQRVISRQARRISVTDMPRSPSLLVGISRGSPLKRAWRQGRVVANAQVGDFLILLLKVLLSQRIELCAVFFFDGGSLAIELLDLVEPGDSIADPGVGGFEAVLEVATLVSITLRRCIMMAAPGSFNLSSGCRLLLVPFPLHRSSTAATALPITKLSHAP